MNTIQGFINFLLLLVPVGATFRIALCLIYMNAAEEHEAAAYKKKALNALLYAVIAESIAGALKLVVGYFGGGVVF